MENEKSIPPKTDGLEQGNVDRTEAATLGKAVWSIRTKLQIEKRIRDLAMFNLASADTAPGKAAGRWAG